MELVIPGAVLASLAILAVVLHRRLRAPASLPVTAAWIDDLSVDRYQPMRRLLGDEDLHFLRGHRQISAKQAAEFRLQRARIFQSYLDCLHSDFARVCLALKVVMVQSRYDRPELAALLIRSQRVFLLNMAMVRAQVLLYRWGLGTVEVGSLLRLFDTARLELRAMVPAQYGMAA